MLASTERINPIALARKCLGFSVAQQTGVEWDCNFLMSQMRRSLNDFYVYLSNFHVVVYGIVVCIGESCQVECLWTDKITSWKKEKEEIFLFSCELWVERWRHQSEAASRSWQRDSKQKDEIKMSNCERFQCKMEKSFLISSLIFYVIIFFFSLVV